MRRPWLPTLRRQRRSPRQSYAEGRVAAPFVDALPDDELDRLNELLPWRCFTVDTHGRPLGGVAWSGKRTTPEAVPDPRITALHERFDLSDKHVLEIGCFEGVHTIALSRLAARVTAVDARVENVVKTLVRCGLFDQHPRVFACDVEQPTDQQRALLQADVCHHVGVLYHLLDPVSHLRALAPLISHAIMLDTHVATEQDATETYEAGGDSFRFRPYRELGRADVFSGMRPQSRWLLFEDIARVLRDEGFAHVDLVEERAERNGARVLVHASRAAA